MSAWLSLLRFLLSSSCTSVHANCATCIHRNVSISLSLSFSLSACLCPPPSLLRLLRVSSRVLPMPASVHRPPCASPVPFRGPDPGNEEIKPRHVAPPRATASTVRGPCVCVCTFTCHSVICIERYVNPRPVYRSTGWSKNAARCTEEP